MDRANIKRFLRALGEPSTQDGDSWVRCPCPLAPWLHDNGRDGHPSFGIKVKPHRESHFHCYSCKSGDLVDLVYILRDLSVGSSRAYDFKTALKLCEAELSGDLVLEFSDEEVDKSDTIFSEIWLNNNFKPAVNVPAAYKYLRGRGLPDAVIEALGIRYDGHRNAVVFPIRNREGCVAQVRGRFIEPGDGPRYHVYKTGTGKFTRHIWHGESWFDPDETVVMVESVFDLASVFRVYRNVIAPLSVGISKELAYRVSECMDIVTLFDNGKGGDKARDKIDTLFPDAIIQHRFPTGSESSDPGDMNQTELFEVLNGLVQLH